MNRETVYDTVRDLLAASVDSLSRDEIGLETSIVQDLGMTSLKMVDLTLAIEDAFGLEEFPIQDWIDQETAKGDHGFAVESLVAECWRLVSGS